MHLLASIVLMFVTVSDPQPEKTVASESQERSVIRYRLVPETSIISMPEVTVRSRQEPSKNFESIIREVTRHNARKHGSSFSLESYVPLVGSYLDNAAVFGQDFARKYREGDQVTILGVSGKFQINGGARFSPRSWNTYQVRREFIAGSTKGKMLRFQGISYGESYRRWEYRLLRVRDNILGY